jgi:hypothetical protein
MANNANPFRLFWPEIDDAASAKAASRLGAIAAILYCLQLAGTATYVIVRNVRASPDEIQFAYVAALIYAVLAAGIWQLWRAPAIVAFVLYLAYQVLSAIIEGGISGYIIVGALTLFFLSGVRGTLAYKKLSQLPPRVDLRDV